MVLEYLTNSRKVESVIHSKCCINVPEFKRFQNLELKFSCKTQGPGSLCKHMDLKVVHL